MFGRCKHSWSEPETLYCAPDRGLTSAKNMSETAMLKMIYGFTTLVQRCADCGIARADTVIGRIR